MYLHLSAIRAISLKNFGWSLPSGDFALIAENLRLWTPSTVTSIPNSLSRYSSDHAFWWGWSADRVGHPLTKLLASSSAQTTKDRIERTCMERLTHPKVSNSGQHQLRDPGVRCSGEHGLLQALGFSTPNLHR